MCIVITLPKTLFFFFLIVSHCSYTCTQALQNLHLKKQGFCLGVLALWLHISRFLSCVFDEFYLEYNISVTSIKSTLLHDQTK